MIRRGEEIFKVWEKKMRESDLHDQMLEKENPRRTESEIKSIRLSWVAMESLSHACSQLVDLLRNNRLENATEDEIDGCIKCLQVVRDMAEDTQLVGIDMEENSTLLDRAMKAGNANERLRLVAKFTSIEEEMEKITKRYKEPFQNYHSELGRIAAAQRARRRAANAPIRTNMEIFIDDFASKFGLELSVESDQIPLTVAYGQNGPSVSAAGKYLTTSNKLTGGAEIEFTKDAKKRKLFVETKGGSMATYDLDQRSFGLSFPVAQYKLEYLGLNIVLRLRN